jgi:hypothetical protein
MDSVVKQQVEIDRPPSGWFALAVMRRTCRGCEWVVFMVDVDPDTDDFQVWGRRKVSERYVLIPGKHRSLAGPKPAWRTGPATAGMAPRW